MNEYIGYLLTFLTGGGITALVTLKTRKKKADVELKVDEISALHEMIEKVYEPTIAFQKNRIEELESEVKSLKEQLAEERIDRQREMDLMNKRILAITSALGIKAEEQMRNEKGQFAKKEEAQ